jgi:hypothetical protein
VVGTGLEYDLLVQVGPDNAEWAGTDRVLLLDALGGLRLVLQIVEDCCPDVLRTCVEIKESS